jgi:hypothetical protein
LARFEFEFETFRLFYLYLCSFGESHLLVSWCAGGRCGMTVATRIMAEVGDLVQRTADGHIGWVLGGRTIERSGGAVCGLHRARGDKERRFLG